MNPSSSELPGFTVTPDVIIVTPDLITVTPDVIGRLAPHLTVTPDVIGRLCCRRKRLPVGAGNDVEFKPAMAQRVGAGHNAGRCSEMCKMAGKRTFRCTFEHRDVHLKRYLHISMLSKPAKTTKLTKPSGMRRPFVYPKMAEMRPF